VNNDRAVTLAVGRTCSTGRCRRIIMQILAVVTSWLIVATLIIGDVLAFRSVLSLRPSSVRLYSSVEGDAGEKPTKCGPCKLAPLCSGEYAEKGCDGTGRVIGGIGAFLPWFPAKVYRPCPAYLAAGYQYRREGQTMDQVLFSEPSDKMKAILKERGQQQQQQGGKEEKKVDGSNAAEVDRILKEWNDKKSG